MKHALFSIMASVFMAGCASTDQLEHVGATCEEGNFDACEHQGGAGNLTDEEKRKRDRDTTRNHNRANPRPVPPG